MSDHPHRNPFPARGTTSAEETSLPDFLRHWAKQAPTAILPGVRGTVRLAEDYARRFQDETTRDGALGSLYGAHGVGKTHAARHMMVRVDRENPDTVQLYLKFQESDFVAAYRRLMTQLPQSLLTDLSLRYLGALAGDQAASAGGPAERNEVMSAIGDDPARVFDLFGAHEVEAGEVLEAQAREIAAVAADGARFQRALSFLLRPEYSDAAYDWLCGRPIGPDASYAIGVESQIDDAQTCRYGLQLLATLVTRAGRPFLLVLDQCEKFVLNEEENPILENLGLLQGLVEVIPRASGLLLLVASTAGWDCMPPDLRQRLGSGAFRMQPLTPGEARLVLGAYIDAAGAGSEAGIKPFTEDGLLELLRRSGGNIRRLLQLAYASFEAADPMAAIDARLVGTASTDGSPDLTDLAMRVETALLSAGLAAERADGPGEGAAFLLPDRHGPRALIKLSEAVFFDDEVTKAVEAVGSSVAVRSGGRSVFTALLVTGYVSPAVLGVLRGTMHRVLVADGSPAFSRSLDELVEQVGAVIAGRDGTERDSGALDETLRMLMSYLEELSSERRSEAVALSRNLSEAAERLAHDRPEERTSWHARHTELCGRIADARASRAAADWEEFRNARAALVHKRRTRLLTVVAGVVAALVAVSVGAATQVFMTISVASALVVVVAAGALAIAGVSASKPLVVHRGGAPLESERDLLQLARELREHAAPDAADPAIRYAYAQRADPDDLYRPLADSLLVEPLALVRQAIARRLAVGGRPPSECVADVLRGRREGVPEMLMLVARRQPYTDAAPPPRTLRELPPELRVLVALANPGVPDLADGPVSRQPAELVLAALGVRGRRHPLVRAYRRELSETARVEIPPTELRAAARLLSPLEREGLGTHDWLPVISEIDGLYLFFEELLYDQDNIRSSSHKS